MAETRIDPFDVGALERSVNDSAGRVSGIWLSFVVFSAYLAAAASMITHRQIFLEEPIKLPTINIDLPLTASAILLPLIFVIYHVFVLLQVVLLARTADTYNEAIEHNVTDEPDRIRIRQRLANTLFAQLFAGSSRERKGVFGGLLRGMAWITLAIAPVGVLIVVSIRPSPQLKEMVTLLAAMVKQVLQMLPGVVVLVGVSGTGVLVGVLVGVMVWVGVPVGVSGGGGSVQPAATADSKATPRTSVTRAISFKD